MMNNYFAIFIFIVTVLLVYDFHFDITWLFPVQCHQIVCMVATAMRCHVVIGVIAQAFPKLSRLPCSIYIPSTDKSKSQATGESNVLQNQITTKLSVLGKYSPLVLSLFLLQYKVRQVHNPDLNNLFSAMFSFFVITITLITPFCWEMVYKTCYYQILKSHKGINYSLELLLFPGVIILRMCLSLLEPVYNLCLQAKPVHKFSLVQYVWSLASKFFLPTIMLTFVLFFHCIIFNLDSQNLLVDHKLNSVLVYVVAIALLMVVSVLPYSIFVVSFVVITVAMGESFDASSRDPIEMPLVFPFLYIILGIMLGYSCLQSIEFQHPGSLLSLVLRSKRFVISISLVDITGKQHSFMFAPYATTTDLRAQINLKLNIRSDSYWLSSSGKPLNEFVPLKEITGTVFMNGRLIGGVQCCIKGCDKEAGLRKLDSMIGQYELKCSPHDLTDLENIKNLRVCDKHYNTLPSRGHKPSRGKKSSKSKSRSNAQLGTLKVTPCSVSCSQCKKEVCLSSDKICNKHNITIFNTEFTVACNFLDEAVESRTEFHSDLYKSIDSPPDGSTISYICMSCQPFFLNAVKLEDQYKKAQSMFEEQQGHSNLVTDPCKQDLQDKLENCTPSTSSNDNKVSESEKCNSLPSKLQAGIFTEGLSQLLKNLNGKSETSEPQHAYVCTYTMFQSVLSDIYPWRLSFVHSKTTCDNLKVVLSKPNTSNGREISNWKEMAFFLPTNISVATNDICQFTVQIMGNQVDNGKLPPNMFQSNIFKSAINLIIKTVDDLRVCPGITDPTLIDTAERKQTDTFLYYVDSRGLDMDGNVTKCIRSTTCSYKLTAKSRVRCQQCQNLLRSNLRFLTKKSESSSQSKTAHNSHAKFSSLSHAELRLRANNLHKMVAQSQRKAKRYYLLYQKEKQKNLSAPKNYNPTSSDLANLMDIAITNQWLTENSVLYALLTDTLKSLKCQEEEFARHGKVTKKKQKPHPKGMRYNPFVIKWSCMIASKCRKTGYDVVRSILPIPSWETAKSYRQAASTTTPISKQNLALMVQEMTRRGCKGIGGIHWDEMSIKEGIVLCKRTGELVGFEDLNIDRELNMNPNDLNNEKEDNDVDNFPESSDSDASSTVSDQESSPSSCTTDDDIELIPSSTKAKLICQFFYSSIEGDFSWPVASFPLNKINHKILSSLVWQVCEAIGSLHLENEKKIEIIYGVSDGSTYSHAFFSRAGAQNWVTYDPFNDNKPIWWLSDYPHMLKKLRNFIVNPDRHLEMQGKKIMLDHLIPVVKHHLTKLNWKHIKLTPRTKMSVKRAVTVCSLDVALDILKGPFPPEDTIATRTYLKQCHNLFRIFNNTELDPLCYKQLLSIMFWFDSWYQETKQTTAQASGSLKDHWKKFIPRLTYKDLKRTIRAFLGVVQYVQMHYPELHIIPKSMCQDDVENYFSLQRARVSGGKPTTLQFF